MYLAVSYFLFPLLGRLVLLFTPGLSSLFFVVAPLDVVENFEGEVEEEGEGKFGNDQTLVVVQVVPTVVVAFRQYHLIG